MTIQDPRKAWPPELIEFSIMTEVHRLAFILKYIVSVHASSGRGYNDEDLRAAVNTIATFEAVLGDARLPREMDEILCFVIGAFRRRPGPLPLGIVDRYYDLVVDTLLRDLSAVPADRREYRQRLSRLVARHWIGDAARVIPLGWLPIVERAVRVGEASIEERAFADVRTAFMAEKFGRLEWAFNGHRDRFAALLSYVGTATSLACMVCTRPGKGDGGPEQRILKLCTQHKDLPRQDDLHFREALYPGGPPDRPAVKLY